MNKLNIKRTKVLFLSPLPPPHYGSAMSSEMCLGILKNSKDFEVKNIKLNYSKNISEVGKMNLSKLRGFFKVKREINEKIKNFSPDLIYFVPATSSFGLLRDSRFVKQIKNLTSKPILFHIRSRILDKDWKNSFFRNLIISTFKGSSAIVLGEELLNDLHGIIPSKNLFSLPNAIDNELSEIEMSRVITKRKKSKKLNILFLSNMEESKGWPKLLAACSLLKKKKINFICNFVGDWPSKKEENQFNSYVRLNSLEKEVFALGKKTGEEKNNFLKNSHVLVFPTEYKLEACPRVILEAMQYSLPVIANGIATIPSTVKHGKTGYLLNKNNPEEIADYLMTLINSRGLVKMGPAARKRFLDNFESKHYTLKFIRILKGRI